MSDVMEIGKRTYLIRILLNSRRMWQQRALDAEHRDEVASSMWCDDMRLLNTSLNTLDRIQALHHPITRRWSSEQPDLVQEYCAHDGQLWPCETEMRRLG